MEGCFTFQWGFCFSGEGASFLSVGCTPWGALVLMGGFLKKIVGLGGGTPSPCPPPHYGKP